MHGFERPVTVIVGLGFPRQLTSARDALEFLSWQPLKDQDSALRLAQDSCRACLLDKVEAEAARGVVEAYARSRGILLDEPLATAALAAKRDLLTA